MKSKKTLKKESSYLPLRNIIKAEAVKVFETQVSKTIIFTILLLTSLMLIVSLYRFKETMEWIRPFNGLASPTITLVAIIFILTITEEWTKGSGMITYCYVPQRERIILGKFLVMLISFVCLSVILLILTAIASLSSSSIHGFDVIWQVDIRGMLQLLIPLLSNLLLGFSVALFVQDSTLALGMYFLIPPLTVIATQLPTIGQYAKWISFEHSSSLFIAGSTHTSVLHFFSSIVFWVVIPAILGFIRNQRSSFS